MSVGSTLGSDFILDTPITWTMVEMDMQKALNTEAKFGENKKAELIGQGNGYVSRMVVVTLDWNEPCENLPTSVALKITGAAQIKDLNEQMPKEENLAENEGKLANNTVRMHNNELAFYRTLKEDWKVNQKELVIPYFYCGREWGVDQLDGGYIALEHVKDTINRNGIYEAIGSCEAIQAFEAIAKFHALSLKHENTLHQFSNSFITSKMFDREAIRAGIPQVVEELPDCNEQVDIIMRKLNIITMENYLKIKEENCHTKVLCHGDFYPGNMLWATNADGTEKLVGLIDWQMTRLGAPIEDFVRFLGLATTWETKSRDLSLYFDKYFEAFASAHGSTPPFTKEQLTEGYEKLVPFVFVPFVPFLLQMTDVLIGSAADKEAAKKVLYNKLCGMLHEAADHINKWF